MKAFSAAEARAAKPAMASEVMVYFMMTVVFGGCREDERRSCIKKVPD